MSPTGDPREKSFKLVMSHEEHAMLLSIANTDGVSAASWLRQRIRAEWVQRNPDHLGLRARKSARATKKK